MTSRTRVNEEWRQYSSHPAESRHDGGRGMTHRRRKQLWRQHVHDVERWRHEELAENDDGSVQASAVCLKQFLIKTVC